MKPLLIRGGRVIDPSRHVDTVADVLIRNGVIEAIEPRGAPVEGVEVVDAAGQVVAPGFIDVHVHLREPGAEDSETIATGAAAAVAGGFTAVCAMPNTDPVIDNQAAVGFVVAQGRRANAARVYPIGAITVGQRGDTLAEFGEMIGAGAIAVSDDGHPVSSSHIMRTALEYAQSFPIPVVDHCEDLALAAGGVMRDGVVSTRLGLKGIPAQAEDIMVSRDVILAELTGGHVHVCHVSSRGSVDIIRRAKERGVRVTAEATPHHFSLTHDACDAYNTNAKMNPPLGDADDVAAVRSALIDGTIDVIATDHAPHHYELKEREFDDAPFGIVGLETAFGVAYTELVMAGAIDVAALIRLLSTGPAQIFRLPGGTLAPGSPADVVVLDVTQPWTVQPEDFRSKSRNTPFAGRELVGNAVMTMVNGQVVFER